MQQACREMCSKPVEFFPTVPSYCTCHPGKFRRWALLHFQQILHVLLIAPPFCCRYNYKLPRYNQIINALTWMSHSQNLRRVAREHVIDLYLRPPVTRFRLMDYHFMDRIVRDANRCVGVSCSIQTCARGQGAQMLLIAGFC